LVLSPTHKIPDTSRRLWYWYGDRYVLDSDMTGPNGATAVVRSLWIIRRGETAPRLTSVS